MGRLSLALLTTAVLSACAPAPQRPRNVPPVTRLPVIVTPPRAPAGLEAVIGHDARALVALFGTPGLDAREGPARKLQFLGPACVLDAYLYPPRRGAEPVVAHVDARLPDGRDTDKAACVEALSRR
ncbi:hypothetical protein [Allosphingosinicella sp.]|uniref:hypothetical protein n=1 Tax=Allosphingosinicella sp. TaxID=2823234 RepID=UPI003784AE08